MYESAFFKILKVLTRPQKKLETLNPILNQSLAAE